MITVRVMTASGTRWRSRARRLADNMLRRAKAKELGDETGGVAVSTEVFDGYLLRGVRRGKSAQVTIMDPPGLLFVPDEDEGYAAGFAMTTGRDLYDVKWSGLGRDPDQSRAKRSLTEWVLPSNLWGSIQDAHMARIMKVISAPKERAGVVATTRIIDLGTQAPPFPYGIPDEQRFGLSVTWVENPWDGYSPPSTTAKRSIGQVMIAEEYIQARCGFRILPRYSNNIAPLCYPQLPFAKATVMGDLIVVAVAVINSSLPSNNAAWRDDAGVGGVLVFALKHVPDEEGKSFADGEWVWKWHQLVRFDTTEEPLLRAELWDTAFVERIIPREENPYPAYVSGWVQNAVRTLDVAFGDDELTVFFTTLHGRQDLTGLEPRVFLQQAMSSYRIQGIGPEGDPPMKGRLRVLAHDVAADASFGAYDVWGSGNDTETRWWFVIAADHFPNGPRALVDSMIFARAPKGSPDQLAMPWISPGIPSYSLVVSGDVAEYQLYSDTDLVSSATRGQVGMCNAYKTGAEPGGTVSQMRLMLINHNAATRVSETEWMVSGWHYPYETMPGRATTFGAAMEIDVATGTFGASRRIPETWPTHNNGAAAMGDSYAKLSCYQRRICDADGNLVRDASVLATWAARVDGLYQRAVYYSLGEETGFQMLREGAGGYFGTFYFGPPLKRCKYGYVFQEE